MDDGASSWLSARPLKEHGFALHKGAFRDAIALRYGWEPTNLPSHCACRVLPIAQNTTRDSECERERERERERFENREKMINKRLKKNTPFRRPSCQAREEKRKFSPTATSLRPPSTKSHVSYCTARASRREKRRPKVHQARRDDRFSSRFLSLLLTAAIVPTRPTPLLLCSPLPPSLSLSDQVWCIQRCDCVNCTYYATNSKRATAAPRLSASLCGFSRVPVGRLVHLI